MNERDELRGTLSNTICNVSFYPKRAQPYLLGGDMSEVLDRTADALIEAGYVKGPGMNERKFSGGGYIPHPNIPDEAVEAAAEAFGHITGTYSRYAAEAILQAAAEHIMAPLVDFLDELEAVDTSVRNYVTVHRLRQIIGARKETGAAISRRDGYTGPRLRATADDSKVTCPDCALKGSGAE